MTENILSTLQKEDIILESNIAKLFKIPFDIKSAETITDDFYEKHKTYKYRSNDGKYLEQSLSLRIELNNNLNTDVTLIVKTVGKFSAESQYVTETYPGLCKNIALKAVPELTRVFYTNLILTNDCCTVLKNALNYEWI